MSVLELETVRKDVMRRILDTDDAQLLVFVQQMLFDNVPTAYSDDAMKHVVNLSEIAINQGQIFDTEQVKAMHPRL